ncbi:MAG: hypothetical protein HZY75_06965 [Nocardioidaceae bacterium]|nr:MAG: hypothetical protein HZY75_06965 [Nocardioidaceae bacterium]
MGEPPSGFDPDNPPSDLPSDLPSDFPSGGPGGGGGGGLGALQDPEVQEALEACGIELPSPGQGSDNSN